MKKALILAALILVASTLLSAQVTTKTLKLTATYSGEEEVNTSQKIHLYLFDTPNISSGAMPIAWNSSSENGSEVSFSGLTRTPVYLVAAFGSYDPTTGPPPSGTPVTVYEPGGMAPTPIELEAEETRIELKFDDSVRMP